MADETNFDLTVLGSGPGGYVAAIRAAQLGMKVAIVERENLGGVCLNWGCIPTKALLKSAEVAETIRRAQEFGLKVGDLQIDFPAIIKRSRQVADRLSKGVSFLMKKNKIQVISGTGHFKTPKSLIILDANGKKSGEVKAERFLLATGARPRNLPGLELDGQKLISYRQAMTLAEQPKSMIIIGAGAIGVEFAYFYHTLGTQVTLVEMLPQILPLEDAEIVKTVHKSLEKAGITIAVSAKVEKVEKTRKGVKVVGKLGNEVQTWEAALCLVAVGVQANSDGIGLEDIGVTTEKGFIKIDSQYRTSCSNVWAIGDVIGAPMLAHAASHEGITAVEGMANLPAHKLNSNRVPSCTYCQPQVASIGMTEAKALAQGHKIKIGRFPFSALGKAVAIGEREGMVKLIFSEPYGELLGAHIVGHDATEMIAELGLAQTHEAIPQSIADTVHAHPTLTEAVMEAALDALGRAIHI
ncbi:MAG: dihydrolipoyl dehydrogenase [bacterium]|nr:dihydrolipoyl dehydrogenase [bacterium]